MAERAVRNSLLAFSRADCAQRECGRRSTARVRAAAAEGRAGSKVHLR